MRFGYLSHCRAAKAHASLLSQPPSMNVDEEMSQHVRLKDALANM